MSAHVLRKNTDANNIRCILLNINERINMNCSDYNVDDRRFICYLNSLVQNGIISRIDTMDGSIPTVTLLLILKNMNRGARVSSIRLLKGLLSHYCLP